MNRYEPQGLYMVLHFFPFRHQSHSRNYTFTSEKCIQTSLSQHPQHVTLYYFFLLQPSSFATTLSNVSSTGHSSSTFFPSKSVTAGGKKKSQDINECFSLAPLTTFLLSHPAFYQSVLQLFPLYDVINVCSKCTYLKK